MLDIKIEFLNTNGQLPKQSTPGAAGWDVYAIKGGEVWAGHRKRIPLGFKVELPHGWQMKVKQRSSMFDLGLITNDSPIDSDYRGEVFAFVNNTSAVLWRYEAGERIGQLLFEPVPVVRWRQVGAGELSQTLRGEGGFGSTGR